MVDGASIARIREIVGARGGKEGSLLTAFGLLCASTSDFKLVIRDAVELLRRILPAETIGYFWSAPTGEMLDTYVEKPTFLSLETWESHETWIAEDPNNWPTFDANVLAGPVVGYLLPYQNEAFYRSIAFLRSYDLIGARHMLDIVPHDGERPFGSYLMMRSAGIGPYSPQELELGRIIGDLTLLAFRERPTTSMDSTRLSDAGLIIFDADGRVSFHNPEAHQSLWLLERSGSIPVTGGPEVNFEALVARYCPELIEAVRTDGRVHREVKNPWGDFEIFGEARDGSIALRIRQYRPFAYHVVTKLVGWDLPARRMTVCWLAMMGLSRKEIAAIAGIGVDTVGEHLDAVFRRLGVRSTVDLLLRIAA